MKRSLFVLVFLTQPGRVSAAGVCAPLPACIIQALENIVQNVVGPMTEHKLKVVDEKAKAKDQVLRYINLLYEADNRLSACASQYRPNSKWWTSATLCDNVNEIEPVVRAFADKMQGDFRREVNSLLPELSAKVNNLVNTIKDYELWDSPCTLDLPQASQGIGPGDGRCEDDRSDISKNYCCNRVAVGKCSKEGGTLTYGGLRRLVDADVTISGGRAWGAFSEDAKPVSPASRDKAACETNGKDVSIGTPTSSPRGGHTGGNIQQQIHALLQEPLVAGTVR